MGTFRNNGPGPALLTFKSTGRIDLKVGQSVTVPDEVIAEFLSEDYPRPGMRQKVTATYSAKKEKKEPKKTVTPSTKKDETQKTETPTLDEKPITETIVEEKEKPKTSTEDETKSPEKTDTVSSGTTTEKAGITRGEKTTGSTVTRSYSRRSTSKSSSSKKGEEG